MMNMRLGSYIPQCLALHLDLEVRESFQEETAVDLNEPGKGCWKSLQVMLTAWMAGTVGLVSRWEVMGQEAEKEGSISGPWYVRPRMVKLVRYIIQ